jgi:Arc/MetJ family transcription regulator
VRIRKGFVTEREKTEGAPNHRVQPQLRANTDNVGKHEGCVHPLDRGRLKGAPFFPILLTALPCGPLMCIRGAIHTPAVASMRTNIVIDDTLMDDALKLTGLKTKREAVELGLKTLIRLKHQEEIRRFRGKLRWDGDLDEMRTD